MSDSSEAKSKNTHRLLQSAEGPILAGVAKALRDVTTDVASYGALNAPVLHGFLRASIKDEDIQKRTEGGRVILRGKVTAPLAYALVQHENTTFKHPKGGKAHYISDRMVENAEQYQTLIGDAIQEALKVLKWR